MGALVEVTLDLPEDLVNQARAAGVLTEVRVAALIEAEIERVGKWAILNQTLDTLRDAAKTEFGEMTQAEIDALIENEVGSARADLRKRDQE